MNTTEPAPAGVTQRLIDINGVCKLTHLAKTTVERHLASGKIPAPRRIGRRNLWDVVELQAWLSRPAKSGGLMSRKEWEPVWQSLIKGKVVPSLN